MTSPNLITRERAVRNLNGYTPTATDNVVLDTLIAAVSSAICKHCRRSFTAQNYDELVSGNGQRRLFLRRFPILAIAAVRYRPVTVLRVINNDQATNQMARVQITATGLVLTRIASGVMSTNTLTYASNATLQALAMAIGALGSGWSAQVLGSSNGDYGLWPALDLYVQPTFGDGIASYGAVSARGQFAELKMHTVELSGYQFDPRGWLVRSIPYTDPELFHPEDLLWPAGIGNFRVQYTAGFVNVPEDVQEACAEWTVALFWQTKRDPGLSRAAVPGASTLSPYSTMPPGVAELLLPYRVHDLRDEG